MDSVNVLVTYRWHELGENLLDRIQAVSPKLKVVYSRDEAEDAALLPSADILWCIWLPEGIAEARRLKWIQLLSAGYNIIHGSPIEKTEIAVTTTSGIHGTPISEFVMAAMVILSRRLLDVWRTTDPKTLWKDFGFMGSELRGKTVGIVGMGIIGREVARLALSFGMRVLGVDIRDRPWVLPQSRYVPYELRGVDPFESAENLEVRSPDGLGWLLEESDFVVLAIPLTPESEHLIGEEELKRMRSTAFLINPARGALINEKVLIRALQEGWIAGAALDAFTVEPLPPESPFYSLPNVFLTPHMSAHTEALWERCGDVFCENLRRFLNGESLLNQVHP